MKPVILLESPDRSRRLLAESGPSWHWEGKGKLWPIRREGWKWIYWFETDLNDPLTLVGACGKRYRPAEQEYETDLGTIPLLAQVIVPKDSYFRSFLLHDSGYDEHGLLVAEPCSDVFRFVTLTRAEVDDLLRHGVVAEGGSQRKADLVWWFVDKIGWALWPKEKFK